MFQVISSTNSEFPKKNSVLSDLIRPVTINGVQTQAFVDCGSEVSCIAKELVDQLGVSIRPIKGKMAFIIPDYSPPRIGIASPVKLTFGQFEVMCEMEVLSTYGIAPVVIGYNLFPRLGLMVFGLPGESTSQQEPPEPIINSGSKN